MEIVERKFCPLCGADALLLPAPLARTYHHCPRCDLIFVPSPEQPSAAEAKTRYELHRNSPEDAGYVAVLRRPIALLRTYGGEARRVLDYGCGPAPVLVKLLQQEGYEASGYDPLFAIRPALTPPYDAVTCIEVFEHLGEPRREIQRLVGLIRPSGCLVVSPLLHQGPEGFADWWYARDVTHVAFYSLATLKWIGEAFGLSLLYCDERSLAVFQRNG